MKTLILAAMVLTSLSSFAQVINIKSDLPTNERVITIYSTSPTDGSRVYLFNKSGKEIGYMYCDLRQAGMGVVSQNGIILYASGLNPHFTFHSHYSCQQGSAAIQDATARNEVVRVFVKVDRENNNPILEITTAKTRRVNGPSRKSPN